MNYRKYVIYILLSLSLINCKHKENQFKKDCFDPDMQINYDFVKEEISKYKAEFKNNNCDVQHIKMYFNTNHFKGLMSIALNEIIIKNCIKSLSQEDKQKAFVAFKDEMISVIDLFNNQFEDTYSMLYKKLEEGKTDKEVNGFLKILDICGLTLANEEGSFYIDENYYYLYKLFKAKVNEQTDDFLHLRSNDLRQGFSNDAAMTISFEDLYERVRDWEDFIGKNPDFMLKKEVETNYRMYLSTLLTGMDNSPAFDYDTEALLPELKQLYEKIIEKNDCRKSTEIISKYYDYLKAKDFKAPEDINKFLKENNLEE